MKKLITMEPGKLEEIVIVAFFLLFFILTIVAESTGQTKQYGTSSNLQAKMMHARDRYPGLR